MSKDQAALNMRIDRDLKKSFETLARDHGVSMSALLRLLMQLATSAYENKRLTKRETGMTRIDIPLVLARPDLSKDEATGYDAH